MDCLCGHPSNSAWESPPPPSQNNYRHGYSGPHVRNTPVECTRHDLLQLRVIRECSIYCKNFKILENSRASNKLELSLKIFNSATILFKH